jgi:hypothetical protein
MSTEHTEEVLESQRRWEHDLEERWRARETLKDAAASDAVRRSAQGRLSQSPVSVPPSMQWAVLTRKPRAD